MWGCSLNDISKGGNWTVEEADNHINYVELLAIFTCIVIFSIGNEGIACEGHGR